jgi:hypothetical protein
MSVGTTLQVYGFQPGFAGAPPVFDLSPAICLHGDFQPLDAILLLARKLAGERWYYVGEVAAQVIVAASEFNACRSVRVLNQSGFLDDTDEFPCLIDISKPTWICYCDRLMPARLPELTLKQLDAFKAPDPDKPPRASAVRAKAPSERGTKRTGAARVQRPRPRG